MGKSTTRSRKNRVVEAIPIMTRMPVIDRQPGLVAIDTVAHCGNTAKGQYAFNYRYDTDAELTLLNELWPLVNRRKNLFLPTKKAIGYRLTRTGKHVRDYDAPRTPADRVKDTGIMLPSEQAVMEALYRTTDLAALTRRIADIQDQLIWLAAAKSHSQATRVA